MKIDKLERAIADIRAQAEQVEIVAGTDAARGLRTAADHFETALREWYNEALTPTQAAEECHWAAPTVAKKIREDALPQAGRRWAPRVTRGDLLAGPREAAVPDIIAEVFGQEAGPDA